MRKIFALLLLLSFCSVAVLAATTQERAKDGYVWEGATRNTNPVTVNIVGHPNIWSLRAAAVFYAPTLDAPAVNAFSYRQRNGTCVIHIIDPEVAYMPEIIGHEFAHCAYGSFHSRGIGYR
jgi:hypothetical protein